MNHSKAPNSKRGSGEPAGKEPRLSAKPAQSLRFRVDDTGALRCSISRSSGEFFVNFDVLAFLMLLSREKPTAKEASAKLQKMFKEVQAELPGVEELQALYEDLAGAGVLASEKRDGIQATLDDGFGDPWIQWAMIADSPRTHAYLKALKKSVTKESVVADVGSGTGIFSAYALHLGAAQVVAIEETSIARKIPTIIAKLGSRGDPRLQVFTGNSADVTLPQQTNLVVSELFGNDPFQEGVLQTLRDIAIKVDRKKVRFLPEFLELFVEPIDIKSGPLYHRLQAYNEQSVVVDTDNDFLSAFRRVAKAQLDFKSLSFASYLEPTQFKRVGKPIALGKITLSPPSLDVVHCSGKTSLQVTETCINPACLYWFRVHLCDDISLSNHSMEADAAAHWSPIIIPLSTPLEPGNQLEVSWELSEDEDALSLEICRDGKKIGGR